MKSTILADKEVERSSIKLETINANSLPELQGWKEHQESLWHQSSSIHLMHLVTRNHWSKGVRAHRQEDPLEAVWRSHVTWRKVLRTKRHKSNGAAAPPLQRIHRLAIPCCSVAWHICPLSELCWHAATTAARALLHVAHCQLLSYNSTRYNLASPVRALNAKRPPWGSNPRPQG